MTIKIHEGEVDIDLSAYSRNEHLYSGEDSDAYPYAQLTELGAQQLIRVGRLLRQHPAAGTWRPPHRSPVRDSLEIGGPQPTLGSHKAADE